MTLDELNRLPSPRAVHEFTRCCGSSRWASAMAVARPFARFDEMVQKGDEIWESLGKTDWLEAFAAHPRLGDLRRASGWSAAEQSGMQSADDKTKERLASLNQLYQRRFGYMFIVCATGRSPAEMLALLEARISNGPNAELRIAADEQRKITGLRLAKLVDAHS
jgi:2-oxo-4-hydroxy-4-carboxy-5-ureidoimidazoline decarboxylase